MDIDDRDEERDPDCGDDDEEEIASMYVLLLLRLVVVVFGEDNDCLCSSDDCVDTIHTLP
jgi:hypothetical protein